MPDKKDSETKAEETPEILTSSTPDVVALPKKKKPEKKPEAKPKAAKEKAPPTVQEKADEYLRGLGGRPANPPEPRVDKRAGKQPPPANQPEPKVTARQFVRARKQRWERCAGFLLEMKRTLGPAARLTMLQWQPLWDAFWTRPVGGLRRR